MTREKVVARNRKSRREYLEGEIRKVSDDIYRASTKDGTQTYLVDARNIFWL
jgi:hypothetical protein